MDTDFSNIDGEYFDGWSLSACKRCNALKFNGLNVDGLAEKCQNFPCQNFVIWHTV